MFGCRSREYFCPLEFVVEIIDGKWKAPIIWLLGDRTLRFGELEKLLPDTARKVLVQQLKELEADGIVTRTVFAQVPPKVEYALTERGLLLLPILDTLRTWGKEHLLYINRNTGSE